MFKFHKLSLGNLRTAEKTCFVFSCSFLHIYFLALQSVRIHVRQVRGNEEGGKRGHRCLAICWPKWQLFSPSSSLALLGNALQTWRQIKQNSMRHLQHVIEWQLQELQFQLQVAVAAVTVARGSLRFMSLSKQLTHYVPAAAAVGLVCCNNSSRSKGGSGKWQVGGACSGSTWGRQLSNGLIDFAFSRIFKFASRHFAMLSQCRRLRITHTPHCLHAYR